jgi:hypothetical protein
MKGVVQWGACILLHALAPAERKDAAKVVSYSLLSPRGAGARAPHEEGANVTLGCHGYVPCLPLPAHFNLLSLVLITLRALP